MTDLNAQIIIDNKMVTEYSKDTKYVKGQFPEDIN